MTAARQRPRPSSPDPGACRDDRGRRGARRRPAGPRRPRRDRGGARRRRQAARPELDSRRRRRRHPGGRRHRRRAQRHPALGRARAGPGRPGPVPGRQARHRAADHRWLLLRLRRRRAVHARGSGQAGKAHAPDPQRRSAVRPAGLRVQGSSPRRTGRRALQARTRRRQVRRPRRHGGRRRRADRLRQPESPYPRTGLGRPVPRPAHPDHQAHSGVQAHPQLGRVLAGRPEQRQPATHLRHRVGIAGGAGPPPAS